MKVAHLTSVHSSRDNRILYKECTSLRGAEFDVTLIAAGSDAEVVNGVKIIGYNKASQSRFKRIFKTSFLDMLYEARKLDADIYHFHDPELIPAGLVLKASGKRVVYDIHENNPASIISKGYIKSKLIRHFLSFTFNILELLAVKFFDALVTARPDISQRFSHKKVVTLRNFPILPRRSDLKDIGIEKTKPAIIYVGGMSVGRGIEVLLTAFETLDAYELWLLGPFTDSALESRVKSGCKNVKYLGVVEPFDIFSYIHKADIGIVTFLNAPNHVTTLATKPFEYMACGMPMIMSDFPYWRDTFGESSLYVDPTNVSEIRDAVVKLISSPQLMCEMGETNKRLTNEVYNWEKESQKLINLYESLRETTSIENVR